jgi:site-specific DNA recombinase
MKQSAAKSARCAVYTRVSTDQGLEQDFNSLDNQREAAEAYIKSQAHEGWRCLSAHYNDGGFSGATMARPALQQLLGDVQARLIDIVVVYKVDRLTRSLADFAKLVELFDRHDVSFVSVTQSFNTTTSMGRLTLNVLLSFAQFEREVTAERIRDKIAASKRRGMRMGGPVPLGYDVRNKRLVINHEEAERVRLIFQGYLQLGSLADLARHLFDRRIHTKTTRRSDGRVRGGIAFTKGPLAHLLKNRVYIGDVVHKGQYYPGEHDPIVDRALFDAVQNQLASGPSACRRLRANNASLLTGRIFDDRGNRMTPSTAKKGSVRYRYYVSAPLLQGRHEDAGSVSRVAAPDVEDVVMKYLKQHHVGSTTPANSGDECVTDHDLVDRYLDKIIIRRNAIEIALSCSEPRSADTPLLLSWSAAPPTRRREVIVPAQDPQTDQRPIRSETRARLVEGIAKARLWMDELIAGRMTDTKEIARREGCSDRSIRMTLSLAFLSPEIIRAAVDGTLPEGLGVSRLTELPAGWHKQAETICSGNATVPATVSGRPPAA